MTKATNYSYRNYAFETRIPAKVAETLGLEKQAGKIEWIISKNGVVTVKKVEVEEGK